METDWDPRNGNELFQKKLKSSGLSEKTCQCHARLSMGKSKQHTHIRTLFIHPINNYSNMTRRAQVV